MHDQKLRLDPEALAVQTFELVTPHGAERGTVLAAESDPAYTVRITCPICSGPYCGANDPSYPNYCSQLACTGGCRPNTYPAIDIGTGN
jgi:hypothetical protein